MPPTLRTRIKRGLQPEPEAAVSSSSDNNNATAVRTVASTPQQGKKKRYRTPSDTDEVVPVTPDPVSSASAVGSNGLFSAFRDLNVAPDELRASATLTTGQSFHWKDITPNSSDNGEEEEDEEEDSDKEEHDKSRSAWGKHDAQEWLGTLRTKTGDTILLHIKETTTTTLYKVIHHHHHRNAVDPPHALEATFYDDLLRAYFQLDEPLRPLYGEWSTQCSRMTEIAQSISGARVLQQDPWETLISFICSSNNNIPRITSMLQSIRKTYGHPIQLSSDYTDENGWEEEPFYYTFPTPQELSVATEKELRSKCGLGYRAKYIHQTTQTILEWGGEEALWSLRGKDYEVVRTKLMELAGVGPKVADCVALFSLDQADHAIPVDVHVWNICLRDYAHLHEEKEGGGDDDDGNHNKVSLTAAKSMTPKLYKRVQEIFRKQFPTKTGWAHSLLFVAELPSFRPALPEHVLKEMDEFKKQEQEKKKQNKKKK